MELHECIHDLAARFSKHRDALVAEGQSAYMKHKFPFFGLKKPVRALLYKEVMSNYALSDTFDVVVTQLWQLAEREFHYAACDLLLQYKRLWTKDHLALFFNLIQHNSWWDTVDTIATNMVGPLAAKYPSLVTTMDEWIEHECMWVRRTAILYQLKYKKNTDANRLFRFCSMHADEREFFIRKAIGWALREYSKHDAIAVAEYIKVASLSSLSHREASKYL